METLNKDTTTPVTEVGVERIIENQQHVSISLFNENKEQHTVSEEEIETNKRRLKEKLAEFNVLCEIANVSTGPVITRYELRLAPGIRVARVQALSKDLAMALGEKIRISTDQSTLGVEVPNKKRNDVFIKDVLHLPGFWSKDNELRFVLGKDRTGNAVIPDLTKMPHLLIAGATGTGKSVCLNSLIASLVYSKTPEQLQLVLIDPKIVEFSVFNTIPHLVENVYTTTWEAMNAFGWAEQIMNERFQLLAQQHCRNIIEYNARGGKLPYIVIVVDELADLIAHGKEVLERQIASIAQKARAVGIHLVLATQRPEAKVITGLIKANIPARIAFAVNDVVNSRIILDNRGAEELLGRGDMLFRNVNETERVQGAYVSIEELERLVKAVTR